MKTKSLSQKIFLITFLFLTSKALIAQSEINSNKESYILTKNDEKILIQPDELIDTYSKEITCTKPFNDPPSYNRKPISVKSNEIKKIVDGDKLYIPVQYRPKKICLARVIAKKNDLTLVSYRIKSTVGDNFRFYEFFGISNSQNELIEKGNMQGRSYNVDKLIKIISKYFGDCIDTNALWDEREYKSWSTPKLLKKSKLITKKDYNFLWNTNQLECQK